MPSPRSWRPASTLIGWAWAGTRSMWTARLAWQLLTRGGGRRLSLPLRRPLRRRGHDASAPIPTVYPGDSDEPGLGRRVGLATYSDHDDAAYRLCVVGGSPDAPRAST